MSLERNIITGAAFMVDRIDLNPWQAPHLAPRDGKPFLALLDGSDVPVVVRRDGKRWIVVWDKHKLGELDQIVLWMPIPKVEL